jgi:hypothetical protein
MTQENSCSVRYMHRVVIICRLNQVLRTKRVVRHRLFYVWHHMWAACQQNSCFMQQWFTTNHQKLRTEGIWGKENFILQICVRRFCWTYTGNTAAATTLWNGGPQFDYPKTLRAMLLYIKLSVLTRLSPPCVVCQSHCIYFNLGITSCI